jgi:hypothetical protein
MVVVILYNIIYLIKFDSNRQQLHPKMQIPNNCMLFVLLVTNSFYYAFTKCVYRVLDDGSP